MIKNAQKELLQITIGNLAIIVQRDIMRIYLELQHVLNVLKGVIQILKGHLHVRHAQLELFLIIKEHLVLNALKVTFLILQV